MVGRFLALPRPGSSVEVVLRGDSRLGRRGGLSLSPPDSLIEECLQGDNGWRKRVERQAKDHVVKGDDWLGRGRVLHPKNQRDIIFAGPTV